MIRLVDSLFKNNWKLSVSIQGSRSAQLAVRATQTSVWRRSILTRQTEDCIEGPEWRQGPEACPGVGGSPLESWLLSCKWPPLVWLSGCVCMIQLVPSIHIIKLMWLHSDSTNKKQFQHRQMNTAHPDDIHTACTIHTDNTPHRHKYMYRQTHTMHNMYHTYYTHKHMHKDANAGYPQCTVCTQHTYIHATHKHTHK